MPFAHYHKGQSREQRSANDNQGGICVTGLLSCRCEVAAPTSRASDPRIDAQIHRRERRSGTCQRRVPSSRSNFLSPGKQRKRQPAQMDVHIPTVAPVYIRTLCRGYVDRGSCHNAVDRCVANVRPISDAAIKGKKLPEKAKI